MLLVCTYKVHIKVPYKVGQPVRVDNYREWTIREMDYYREQTVPSSYTHAAAFTNLFSSFGNYKEIQKAKLLH